MARAHLDWKDLERLAVTWRFNSSRVHLAAFLMRAANSVGKGDRVLDAGAGNCMYQKYFAHAAYESADFCQVNKHYGNVTFSCDLRSIPVENERYELVLLTQVLEHLSEPLDVLKELNRVMKPRGRLWLSVPLFYEEHEQPYDFYRYTQFGLQNLLAKAGFEIEELDWLEGYYGTLAYEFDMASRCLPIRPKAYGGGWLGPVAGASVLLLRPAFSILSVMFARLDVRHKYTLGGHCKNYCVIAAKAQ